MKAFIYLFTILFVVNSVVNAQQTKDLQQLKNDLVKASTDSAKTELLFKLGYEYLAIKIDSSAIIAKQIIKSNKNKTYTSRAYTLLATITERSGNIEKASLFADTALELATIANNHEAFYLVETIRCRLERRKANFSKSVKFGNNALNYARLMKDKRRESIALLNLGIVYTSTQDLKSAEQLYKDAIEIQLLLKDPSTLYSLYENLGIIKREQGMYQAAIEQYKKGLAVAEKMNDSSLISFSFNDIGAAYSFLNQTAIAESFLKKSIDIRNRIKEKNELAYTYNYLGENYERKKDLPSAELYIKKALSTAKEISNTKQTYEALESLSTFYSRIKKYDSAYAYLNLYISFRDSVRKKDNQKIIDELLTKYETEKKEKIIAEQSAKISSQKKYLFIALLVLILLVVIGYFLFNKRKLQEKVKLQKAINREQEIAAKNILAAEEAERSRLAAELHDGVGQIIGAAILNLQQSNTTSIANTTELLKSGYDELRHISHQMIPNSLLKHGLSSAIRELISRIDSNKLQIILEAEGLTIPLDKNVELVLYRVIQEAINNVIKHAKANKLFINILNDEKTADITIEDNGIGFNKALVNEGLGLQNMQHRIHFLKGTLHIETAEKKGTVLIITIPLI
jgi:two-component system, NarL family, sensor kinase